MQSTYRLKANEVDETEYLFKSEANKQRLMQAKTNVENKTNLVEAEFFSVD